MSVSRREARHIPVGAGGVLRIEPITPHVFRIRLRPDDHFVEPALVRYGVLKKEWSDFEVSTAEDASTVTFGTGATALTVSKRDGRMTFCRASGERLIQEAEPPPVGRGVGVQP